ncbi:SgcJ/EcaC family oxidoreductase [Laspinema sp. D1]|uniref:YybH family protein n=1 Tax=Laspinema palackyanum TaxID=3231601 RepID=UPI003499EBDC|nr:SgcJ/EcaC family oxidoreductase [Laspinema sp. D2b]
MSFRDREEIRQIFEEIYPSNVRSMDLMYYAEMYTEDALWMPPDSSDCIGIHDIVQGFAEQCAHQSTDPTFNAEEIEVIGDFGYVIGSSAATIYPKDGSPAQVVQYRALWLMKKEGNSWKINRQIWNKKL